MKNEINGKTCFNYEAKRNYFGNSIPSDNSGWGYQNWKSDINE